MKIIQHILLLCAVIFVVTFIYSFFQTIKYVERFENIHLPISRAQLIENWEKPDKEFDMNLPYHPRHIIMYRDLIGYRYIFVIKKNEKMISEKYIDD